MSSFKVQERKDKQMKSHLELTKEKQTKHLRREMLKIREQKFKITNRRLIHIATSQHFESFFIGQSRPLFVYFRSFHIPIQMKK